MRVWNSAISRSCRRAFYRPETDAPNQVEYTNAKVLLVGDTSSGKTGIAHRLATGEWKPSDGSTVGAWSTQWKLPEATTAEGLEREIWLWDFGGQADQRLVHQLYMDRAALVLLLFDADKEDVLPGLRDWQVALRRTVPPTTPQLLVAGRIDAGFRASRAKLQAFAEENGFRYHETSAKEGHGCAELSRAILEGIPWALMERRTSPRIFKASRRDPSADKGRPPPARAIRERSSSIFPGIGLHRRDAPDGDRPAGRSRRKGSTRTASLIHPEGSCYSHKRHSHASPGTSELGCLPLRSISQGKLLFQTVGRDGAIEARSAPDGGAGDLADGQH